MRKLSHETLGVQKNALVGEEMRAFAVGDRVLTVDGYPGQVTAVLDGPYPSTEQYEVILDRGVGGGTYAVGQLSKDGPAGVEASLIEAVDHAASIPAEAATTHTALDDYPELGTILTDRLPNENIKVYAGLRRTAAAETGPDDLADEGPAAGTSLQDKLQDQAATPEVQDIEPPHSCSFCGNPEFDEFTNTGRGTRARCATCGGTMTSWGGQWQPDPPNTPANAASRAGDPRATINDLSAVQGSLETPGFLDLDYRPIRFLDHVMASLPSVESGYDPDFGFHMMATWADVRNKAKRLRAEGGVRILAANQTGVVGEVKGDTALYESSFNYVVGSKRIADWSCGCKWGAYSWGRSPAYARFEGRQCSHVTALQFEARSRGMFGRTVSPDSDRLDGQYQRTPVTVQYDRANDANLNRRSVPPGNMRTTFSSMEHTGSINFFHDGPEPHTDGVNLVDTDHHEGRLSAFDENARHIGDVHYSLHAHGDEEGGLIRSDVAPAQGHGYHERALRQGLDDYLQHRGFQDGYWQHDDEGQDANRAVRLESHYATLDLAPVHVFAKEMASNHDEPEAIFQMLASHGVEAQAALGIVAWAAREATAPETGGAAQPGTDIPRLDKRDQSKAKKHPKHKKHHTNDARQHAPEFGRGISPLVGPLLWCDQCNGSGCGHCGGTGQVIAPGGTATGGAGVGDGSTTTSPVADQNEDAGDAVSSDGVTGGGAVGGTAAALQGADTLVGDNNGQMWHSPTHHSDSRNPASTGWATSQDPTGWEAPLMSTNFGLSSYAKAEGDPSFDPPTVSGVALKAADTGRVLMIQRSHKDESDPARGTWEFPGGHHEEGDQTSLHAGIREWEEEVGQQFPEGGHVSHTWRSGPYQGHVVVVPSEDQVALKDGRTTTNPDDPDGDDHEQSAWWEIEHAKKNPALRSELKQAAPWAGISKAAGLSTLNDEPEAALPSTDGADDQGAPEAPGMYLAAQPTVPWGYSAGEPDLMAQQATHPSLDAAQTPQEIVAAFQATAGGKAIMHDSSAGGGDPSDGPTDSSIAAMAQAVLAGAVEIGENGISKNAMKDFSFAEQQELISEGVGGVRARNFNDLQIQGTHYEKLGDDTVDDDAYLLL